MRELLEAEQFINGRIEGGDLYWLWQVFLCRTVQAGWYLRVNVSADNDDRGGGDLWDCSNSCQHVITVHVGQGDVEENEVGNDVFGQLDTAFPCRSTVEIEVLFTFQDKFHQLAVSGIILYVED